jgi:hypothetical protein
LDANLGVPISIWFLEKNKEHNDHPLRMLKELQLSHKNYYSSTLTDLHPEEEFSAVMLELQDVNPSR